MSVTTYSKPDFIGIGPPKTGTTWIYKNLTRHPQVAMPPDKEIRFFYEKEFVGDLHLYGLLTHENWHVRSKRLFHRDRFRAHLSNLKKLKVNFKELYWDFKYFIGNRSNRWYASLFDESLVSGDISAKYCEISEKRVADIKRCFPTLKVLITLRDPIEREWSRAKMNLSKKPGRPLDEVEEHEFITQFNAPYQMESNDYADLIETWTTHFTNDQVLVLFYDELLDDPFTYFTRICGFLDIELPDEQWRAQLEEYVFKGVTGGIPERFRKVLYEMHEDKIERLAAYYPDIEYPKKWLEKHREMLAS